MDSVAAQPTAPAASRSTISRFGNLLKPLRKSTSTKVLKNVASYDGYSSFSQSPYLNTSTSPLDSSWQSGSRSPIQPYTPPVAFGFTSNKARIGRALGETSRGESHWAGDANYIPYRGPISPPSDITPSFSQQQQRVDDRHHSNLTGLEGAFKARSSNNIGGEQVGREVPASIPRYKDVQSASTGLGLEELQASPSEGATNKGRYIGTGLPSAYTHGGNAPLQGSSSAVRSVANQSFLPSLLRFDADTNSGTLKQAREVQIRQPGYVISRVPPSTSSPLIKHSFTQDRPGHHSKAPSLDSSEGNHSSMANEASRSTSMTSLRDQSSTHGSKARRPSQEGPPLSASAKSRSKMATSSTIEAAMQHNEPSLIYGKADSTSTSFNSPPSSFAPMMAHEVAVPTLDVTEEKVTGGQSSEREVMAASPLSTIQSSTPATARPAAALSSGTDWVQHQDNQRMTTPTRREDAHQKYLLLQQLHLDEMANHAPDHDGWLEPNNGCERVLMPKPSLKGKGKKAGVEKRSSDGMTFERNRKGQADESDAAKAQAIFSGAEYSSTARLNRGRDETPVLFHHRMPPATPDLGRNVSATPSSRPAHVTIPPRRSSHSRRRRAETVTPALTFQHASEDDDNDSTPDLATVLAQGRALDEERDRWREQYRRSLIKASRGRSKSREGSPKKVRYNDEPLPDLSGMQDHLTAEGVNKPIRQAKSTPDMRKSMSRGAYRDDSNVGVGAMCIAPFRDPSSRQQPQEQRHLRQRSKSQEGLSTSFRPSICFPMRSRRRRATTLLSDEEKSGVTDPFRSTHQAAKAQDEPIVISRHVAAVKEGDTDAFNFPSARKQVPSRLPSDTNYGIAYSAPRPDIGKAAPKEETFAAGRHATTQQYHIHSSSDDLRAMLASSSRQSGEQPLESKGRSATVRTDSLGMSQVLQSIDDHKQTTQSARRGMQYESASLPVPPRKNRNSQAMSLSPASGYVELHPPTPPVTLDDFSAPDNHSTPILGRLNFSGQERGIHQEQRQMDRLGVEEVQGGHLLGPSRQQKAKYNEVRKLSRDNSGRLTVHSTSSSSDSSYSPRSVAARELWNTDDHTDEAFQSLFVRRPRHRSIEGASVTKSELPPTPKIGESARDIEQALSDDSKTRDSVYRSSLDTRRDSANVEKLVGSYLSTLSPTDQTDKSLERSSMLSDIELYRQGIRLGRVGGRTPVISPGYHSANEQGQEQSDDEEENPGVKGVRTRLDSLAASLVLTVEGNSPNEQEHAQAPLDVVQQDKGGLDGSIEQIRQADDRSSDDSLAKMVRDYIWPDPPNKSE